MRDNFIRHGPKYWRGEVFGLLFVTCRIRGAPNTDFVVRDTNGGLYMDLECLRRASEVEAWALLELFWTEYPELVYGMDPAKFMISVDDLT